MSKVVIEVNQDELFNIMKSKEMMAICTANALEIRSRLGEGYGTDEYVGKTRVNASVGPKTKEAYQDNLENNTLLKALR